MDAARRLATSRFGGDVLALFSKSSSSNDSLSLPFFYIIQMYFNEYLFLFLKMMMVHYEFSTYGFFAKAQFRLFEAVRLFFLCLRLLFHFGLFGLFWFFRCFRCLLFFHAYWTYWSYEKKDRTKANLTNINNCQRII